MTRPVRSSTIGWYTTANCVVVERLLEIGLQLEAVENDGAHLGNEQLRARLPLALGGVEGHVGVADECVLVRGAFHRVADAEAHRHGDLAAAERERHAECVEDPRRELRRLGPRVAEADDEDAELVAADAGHGVLAADARAQPFRRRDQQLVAGLVAERVVHELEVVDVEHDHAHAVVGSRASEQRLGDAVLEQRTVGEPGQRVVEGEVAQLLLAGPEIGDRRLQVAVELAVLEQRRELAEHDEDEHGDGGEHDDGIVTLVEDQLLRPDEARGDRERIGQDDLSDGQRRGGVIGVVAAGAARGRSNAAAAMKRYAATQPASTMLPVL